MLYRIIYNLILYLALPVVCLLLFRPRSGQTGYGRRWPELFGWTPAPKQPAPLWIHTVSVGETLAATPLLRELKSRYPGVPLIVTTTTRTGAEQVARLGDLVEHRYAPLDYPDAVARFLRRIQPCGLMIMETELWPNWLAACHHRQLPVAVMNARLSERSCQRYQKVQGVFREMSRNISLLLCQHRDDAARFARLGVSSAHLQVTGSLKYDIRLDEEQVEAGQALRREWGSRPVWIAASTHQGEDESVLAAMAGVLQQHPDALLVLVPRHPERFERVAKLCEQTGWGLARRSKGEPVQAETHLYLGDCMGEMPLLFQTADVAFMGGSLVPVGGHNLLEPASLGKPTLIGPHYFNFTDITRQLVDKGACQIIANHDELATQLNGLFADPERAQQMGTAGFDVVNANQGAQSRTIRALEKCFNLQKI